MNKDVYITIKSVQTVEEESDTTELFTVGKMAKEKGRYILRYEESEATGFQGSRVKLSVDGNEKVTMERSGKTLSNLIIEKGKKHHCHYGTEFGDFMVGISTDEIKNEIGDNGGDLYFKYTIDINSSYMSDNELFINIKESNN